MVDGWLRGAEAHCHLGGTGVSNGVSNMGDAVKIGFVRKTLLFVISVAMVVAGLLMIVFELSAPMPRGLTLFVAGGAMLAFLGLYLLWEDFIAPWFRTSAD
jgi:hypothetical protein